uniref:Uncharacterized protein n=1 Tax=viral metagenome TaxID=1070528 RepID=A0A6C0C7K4_9ZZZZ
MYEEMTFYRILEGDRRCIYQYLDLAWFVILFMVANLLMVSKSILIKITLKIIISSLFLTRSIFVHFRNHILDPHKFKCIIAINMIIE